jgi:hypothetical protein
MQSLKHPLTPFVDNFPVPPRLVFSEPARLSVRLEPAEHRFHRDLPPSRVWAYGDGNARRPQKQAGRTGALAE